MKATYRILAALAALAISGSAAMAQQPSDTLRTNTLKKASYLKSVYRTDEAITLLTDLLKENRMDLEVMDAIVDCHMMKGDYEEAEKICNILTTMAPASIPYKIKLIQIQSKLGEFMFAAQTGKAILQLDTIPAIISLTGDYFAKAGQQDSAMTYYDLALDINPMNTKVISKKAKILLDKKEYGLAHGLTYEYLEKDPDNPEIAPILGVVYYLINTYQYSVEVLSRQRDLGNDTYGVHFYLGQSLWQLGQNQEAKDELLKAWQLDSTDANLAYCIGYLDNALGNDPNPWLDKALDMVTPDPKFLSKLYQQYGAHYYAGKDFDKSVDYYTKAFAYNSEFISALSVIGYCYEQKKDYKKALEWYNKYLDVGEPDTKAYNSVKERIAAIKQESFMNER